MASYSYEERIRMLQMYNECNRNSRAAARMYAKLYPDERKPTHKTILGICNRFQQTGGVERLKSCGRPRSVTNFAHEEDLLAFVLANPGAGTRAIANAAGISQRSVVRILKRPTFGPYRELRRKAIEAKGLPDHEGWTSGREPVPGEILADLKFDETTRIPVGYEHCQVFSSLEDESAVGHSTEGLGWKMFRGLPTKVSEETEVDHSSVGHSAQEHDWTVFHGLPTTMSEEEVQVKVEVEEDVMVNLKLEVVEDDTVEGEEEYILP